MISALIMVCINATCANIDYYVTRVYLQLSTAAEEMDPTYKYIRMYNTVKNRMCEPLVTDPSANTSLSVGTDLPTKAHQPRKFNFLKRSFGNKTMVYRSFQPLWFEKWLWLHYLEDYNAVICITCVQASAQKSFSGILI